MQYLNHDFYTNFNGSVTSGDVEMTIDLWVNELSDLIVHSPEKVIDLLNKTKVSAKLEDSNEELVDKILNNVGTNNQLNRGLSFLIGEQNNLISDDPKNDWKKSIDTISEKYQTLLRGVVNNPTIKSSVKIDLMQHIKSKAEGTGKNTRINFIGETPDEQKKKNKKIFWYIAGGVAVLALTGLAIYLVKKHKLKKLSLATGGDVPVTTSISTPVVAHVAAPVVPPVTVAPAAVVAPTPVVHAAPVV